MQEEMKQQEECSQAVSIYSDHELHNDSSENEEAKDNQNNNPYGLFEPNHGVSPINFRP